MASERMFRVIVLGGIALTSGSLGAGCSSTAGPGDGGDVAPDRFPSELPTQLDVPPPQDTGTDAAQQPDAFPAELPIAPDSGPQDAGSPPRDCSFPSETAFVPDC